MSVHQNQLVLVCAQSHPNLCDPRDYSPPGSSVQGLSRQEYWSGLPCLPPGDLPNPGIEPRSPAMQVDSFFFFCRCILYHLSHQGNPMVKNTPANAGDSGDAGLIPGMGRSPGGGNGNPLQYSCLENPHGQRSLEGCSPCGHKESDTTDRLSTE